jgi:hypothetical protein
MSQPRRPFIPTKLWGPRLIFGLLLVASIFSFQNCTQPADLGGTDPNASLSNKMNFSYDATIDQIAYMSCPGILQNGKPVDSDLYFTIRAGAYRTGGIKLSDEFFNTYQGYPMDGLASLLMNSPANSNTVVQLATRGTGALNQVVTSGGAATQNLDFANVMAILGSGELSWLFVTNGLNTTTTPPTLTENRLRYLRAGTGYGAHFEGNLNYGSSEAIMTSWRTQVSSGASILALTYLEPTSGAAGSSSGSTVADTNVRNPGTAFPATMPNNPGMAYGLGYQLTFAQPAGAVGLKNLNGQQILPYPSNLLVGVSEKNLLTGAQTGAQWTCPATLRYLIVQPGDEPETGCLHSPDIVDPNDPQYAEFKIIRNALRTEDWYIDTLHHCVVPKRTLGYNCYGAATTGNNSAWYVQYNLSSSAGCDPNSNSQSNLPNDPICAAFVSVCYRTN